MPITLVRIDDRLVHGQVVEGWLPFLRAQRVLVVSDAAASDETQVMLMQLALPDEVELTVLPVAEAASDNAAAIRKASHRMEKSPEEESIGGNF